MEEGNDVIVIFCLAEQFCPQCRNVFMHSRTVVFSTMKVLEKQLGIMFSKSSRKTMGFTTSFDYNKLYKEL
jgi:hypothetical protein